VLAEAISNAFARALELPADRQGRRHLPYRLVEDDSCSEQPGARRDTETGAKSKWHVLSLPDSRGDYSPRILTGRRLSATPAFFARVVQPDCPVCAHARCVLSTASWLTVTSTGSESRAISFTTITGICSL
jgi:hypothetical protein